MNITGTLVVYYTNQHIPYLVAIVDCTVGSAISSKEKSTNQETDVLVEYQLHLPRLGNSFQGVNTPQPKQLNSGHKVILFFI